ncbi:MAG: OadG family protein [Ruminococcus sp.]|nr:OadG family protein [Ruminococcus sp.]
MKYTLLAAAAATAGKEISIGEAAVTAVFGYCVVFFGLIILMCVLYGTGAYFKSKDEKANAAKKAAAAAEAPAKAAPAAPAPEKPKAPGSAGHIKLHDVPDKDAAMIMAIVADKMQKPINELHFISIKEVK